MEKSEEKTELTLLAVAAEAPEAAEEDSWLLLSEQPSPAWAPLGVSAIDADEAPRAEDAGDEAEAQPSGAGAGAAASDDAGESDAMRSIESGSGVSDGEGHGAAMVVAAPEGSTSVSPGVAAAAAAPAPADAAATLAEPAAMEEPRGDGLKARTGGADAGGRCCVMASCSRHLTSSAHDRSSGVCDSWFFMCGSAPWASSSAHSCVRPFCAASCSGVKPQRSVALT